jgi:hypothetical protein
LLWPRQRHHASGRIADLRGAAALSREVVETVPATDPDRPMFVAKAAIAIRDLYDKTKRPELLKESVALARVGLRDLPPGHSAEPSLVTALAAGLYSSYLDTKRPCGGP